MTNGKNKGKNSTLAYNEELDRVLQEIATRWGIPGMGVGIVQAADAESYLRDARYGRS